MKRYGWISVFLAAVIVIEGSPGNAMGIGRSGGGSGGGSVSRGSGISRSGTSGGGGGGYIRRGPGGFSGSGWRGRGYGYGRPLLFQDRWWWYDPAFARWDYWWDGFWWWWPSPGVVYVYMNGEYQPYQGPAEGSPPPPPSSQTAHAAPSTPAASAPVPAAAPGKSWSSPDGKRMVQVIGSREEAFLYDTSGSGPAYMRYLTDKVVDVQFSGGSKGTSLQIRLKRKDGSYFSGSW